MNAFGKASGGGRRTASRENAPLLVLISTLTRTLEAVLVDLSATGARLTGCELPPVGEELYFSVLKLKTVAVVRWRSATECGLQFYEPLPQAEVTEVRRAVAKGAGLDPAVKAALDDWVLGLAR
ncbi:PilZ domain-containing protein [Sphingomonas sp. KRR8]|uniref:PilZ domain-containing protein n=1 Tax=Sphingomonas sp. KRR8 TaxID=2942996 RepID=UPI0024C4E2EF|nr:PilZ domain-containing protein [Sphingomonas sp. KRR8]